MLLSMEFLIQWSSFRNIFFNKIITTPKILRYFTLLDIVSSFQMQHVR